MAEVKYTTSDGKVLTFDPDKLDPDTKIKLQNKIREDKQKKSKLQKENKILTDTGSTGDEEEFNDIGTLTGFRQAYYGSQIGYNKYYAKHVYHTLANIPGFF